jgi:hypothetical protein
VNKNTYHFIPTRNTPPVRAGMERGRNTEYCGPDVLIAINQRSEVGTKNQDATVVRRWSFIFNRPSKYPAYYNAINDLK